MIGYHDLLEAKRLLEITKENYERKGKGASMSCPKCGKITEDEFTNMNLLEIAVEDMCKCTPEVKAALKFEPTEFAMKNPDCEDFIGTGQTEIGRKSCLREHVCKNYTPKVCGK